MAKLKKISFFVICIFLSGFIFSQTAGFRFYGNIPTVDKSGLYNIQINPDISATLKNDYSDVRIINNDGKWNSHLLRLTGNERISHKVLYDLEIISKLQLVGKTTIILRNQTLISNIILSIRNSNSERFSTLTGSDDQTTWYAIKDSILIKPEPTNEETSIFQFNFPDLNYKYFKIVIHNNQQAPYNISKAMVSDYPIDTDSSINFNPTFRHFAVTENPRSSFIQKDSAGTTLLKVHQEKPFHFNEIYLKVDAPAYYTRRLNILIPGKTPESFTISNNTNSNGFKLQLGISNAVDFSIQIINDDNPPLRITDVKTVYPCTLLASYLDSGKKYKLYLGNDSIAAPVFDMENIARATLDSAPILSINELVTIKQIKPTDKTGTNFPWIWIAIVCGIVSLSFLSVKLIKDISTSKKNV